MGLLPWHTSCLPAECITKRMRGGLGIGMFFFGGTSAIPPPSSQTCSTTASTSVLMRLKDYHVRIIQVAANSKRERTIVSFPVHSAPLTAWGTQRQARPVVMTTHERDLRAVAVRELPHESRTWSAFVCSCLRASSWALAGPMGPKEPRMMMLSCR